MILAPYGKQVPTFLLVRKADPTTALFISWENANQDVDLCIRNAT